MKVALDKIRALIEEIEREAGSTETRADRALVTGLELPDIVRDVVDLLFPELKPYEAAVYMYMLRHSVVETGSQLMRVSRRGLQSGVIKSPVAGTRSGGGEVDVSETSYKTIRVALEGLEALGAIRRESEPNRDGTLYRVLLPEELEVCRKLKQPASWP